MGEWLVEVLRLFFGDSSLGYRRRLGARPLSYCFEDQVLDLARRQLRRAGIHVKVEPRVFDLLVYMIENKDRVVSKDDLIAQIWRGRIVSDSALTGAINAARQAVGDNGRDQRLIRTMPRKGFRFVGTVSSPAASQPFPALELPARPSIAVLPFANLSSEPGQEHFADGMVDDIITALSRFKALFVIARNSSFTYKGRVVDIRQVGRELGVRYVLQGSVRKLDDRMRVTGQLLDSRSAGHLWADRFDGSVEDVFELQDRITAEVASRLVQKIEQTEIERVTRRPTTNPSAYESHLLGMSCLYRSTRESVEEALRHFYRAIELDPAFAEPHAWASIAYTRRRQGQWMEDIRRECDEGIRLGRRSVELRDDDALTLGVTGFALAYLGGEIEAGLDFLERALELNPNSALMWHGAGWIRLYNGEHDRAIECLSRAARYSPLDPQTPQFLVATTFAHCCAGRFEEATSSALRALQRDPDLVIALVAFACSSALAGRLDVARSSLARATRLNPSLRQANFGAGAVMRRPEDRAILKKGMLLAGMPE